MQSLHQSASHHPDLDKKGHLAVFDDHPHHRQLSRSQASSAPGSSIVCHASSALTQMQSTLLNCTLHKCTLHNSTIQQHRFTLSFCTYSSLYCCISFVKCAVHRIELLIALYFGYFTQMKSLVLQCIACTLSYNVLVGKLTNLRGAFPFLINLTSQPPLSEFTPNDVCLVSCHLTNRNGKCLGKLSFYIVQSGIIQFLTSL